MKTSIILGPPGTGKTTRLLNLVEKKLDEGISPDRIMFVSFTKKASEEAKIRAAEKFGLSTKDFPYFRTLHSLAFQQLGLRRDEVLQSKNLREIGKHLGLEFSTRADVEEGVPSGRFRGDRYTFLDGYARARCITPAEAWYQLGGEDDLDWFEFKRFVATLDEYKRQRNLLDFPDMIEQIVGSSPNVIPEVVFVDEAQDLSSLLWKYATLLFQRAKEVYIAGDDDQAIYQWSGADVKHFQSLQGTKEVLSQSHRIPSAVHRTAEGISNRIVHRYPKQYQPKPERGSVEYHASADDIDLSVPGTWLLLARNIHLLSSLVSVVRSQGLPYNFRGESAINKSHIRAIRNWEKQRKGVDLTADEQEDVNEWLPRNPLHRQALQGKIWHEALLKIPITDREFYISLLRRGESLTKEPRVSISTIHGVKGGEASNVLLLTDMSARTWAGYQQDQDSELRVWYVGATRAKQNLHIVVPQTRMGIDI